MPKPLMDVVLDEEKPKPKPKPDEPEPEPDPEPEPEPEPFHLPPRYKMPSIKIGEMVVWSFTPDGDQVAAIVTQVGQGAISVFMMPPDSQRGVIKDGVRHVDDPDLIRMTRMNEGGCWRDTRSMALLRDLGRLRRLAAWAD